MIEIGFFAFRDVLEASRLDLLIFIMQNCLKGVFLWGVDLRNYWNNGDLGYWDADFKNNGKMNLTAFFMISMTIV